MSENSVISVIEKSGLDEDQRVILINEFSDYERIAREWEEKAKTIVVTDASQKDEMQLARTGRLLMREKRLAVEKRRKELKERSLKEGRAIDSIAKALKSLIEPIEEHFDRQEHFVEIQAKAEADRIQKEMEAKAEAERIAKEKAEREEQERIRKENALLKEEALKKEREAEAERKRVAAEIAAKEKAIAEEREKREAEKREAERKAREESAKAEAERKRLEKEVAEAKAAEVECPYCHRRFVPNS